MIDNERFITEYTVDIHPWSQFNTSYYYEHMHIFLSFRGGEE